VRLNDHPTFASAFVDGLARVLTDGETVQGVVDPLSIGSGFGSGPRGTRELRPHGFSVADARSCLFMSDTRPLNLSYAVGHWLWALRGGDRLDEITRYNPRGRVFSDDNKRLNAAVGARLLTPVDQVDAVLALLASDPTTRRAQFVLARSRDTLADSRDISCPTSAQLFHRDGRLDMAVTMRSQSAFGVLPYDAAFFMFLQCWLADMLGIPVGKHMWMAWSFHIYMDEVNQVEHFLRSPNPEAVSLPRFAEPSNAIPQLAALETAASAARDRNSSPDLETCARHALGLTGAERLFAAVLVAHFAEAIGDRDLRAALLDAMPETWRALMVVRSPAWR
jgi:Thymidylate synthase